MHILKFKNQAANITVTKTLYIRVYIFVVQIKMYPFTILSLRQIDITISSVF
ncbi:MAG: hypothetical protein RL172_1414 [Bacteroidota bacterium]|jgi:hypothetical protein